LYCSGKHRTKRLKEVKVDFANCKVKEEACLSEENIIGMEKEFTIIAEMAHFLIIKAKQSLIMRYKVEALTIIEDLIIGLDLFEAAFKLN